MTYTLTNVTDRAKTVYIEHPVESDEEWKLVSTPKLAETTENFQRFKVSAAPHATAQLKVNEELPDITTFACPISHRKTSRSSSKAAISNHK